ncbi:lanthionine synthetase C family protein [Streptomyces sp. NPDC059002]|uniref:lanthionine synthetase C family protein n=1 Tax=Streptomyces sp. NPDC059002 TaxID=3346690 RepID=UPI003690FE6D
MTEPTTEPRHTLLPPDTAAAALDLATTLAGQPRPAPTCVRPDLADGGPGIALAYHQLHQSLPAHGWDDLAHGYLTASAAGARRLHTTSPGLFGGLAGLAYTAWTLTGTTDTLPGIHENLTRQATAQAHTLTHHPHGTPARTFDTISGLTGTGAYLLCRHHEPQTRHALHAVLTALVTLCREHDGTPHWYTPAAAIQDTATRKEFPHGMLDHGLAHGIAGPLALLSLALAADITVPGHTQAVARTAHWLAAQHTNDTHGPDWPAKTAPPGHPAPPTPRTAGASWCYGSPGIARSLWLAGSALQDPTLLDLSLHAIKAVHQRPTARHRAHNAPGLCHGLAGLLHITARWAHETKEPDLTHAATELTQHLLTSGTFVTSNGPGLLDGTAGVLLALLSATADTPPTWDRALLLA